MDDFNPDVYLAQKTASDPLGGFDPDQYLAEKETPLNPKDPEFISTTGPTAAPNIKNYPESLATDPSVSDAMNVMGAAGLAKSGAGLLARGAGKALNAVPLTKNIVPSIGDAADDMLLKGIGARFGQASKVGGIEEARHAARVGRMAGADDILSTERGSREAIQNLIKSEGKDIGSLRDAAGNPTQDMLSSVKENVSAKYSPKNKDVFSRELPQVEKAMNTVTNVAGENPTHAGIAKGLTKLNKYARTEKAGNRQINALTKTANELGNANDAGIVQSLGADKGATYLKKLENEKGLFELAPFVEKGAAREALARGGHGNVFSAIAQKAADAGGYRAASKGLNAIHGAMSNPATVNASIPSQEFMAQQLEDYLREKYD